MLLLGCDLVAKNIMTAGSYNDPVIEDDGR